MATIASKITRDWRKGKQEMEASDGLADSRYNGSLQAGVGDINLAEVLEYPEGRQVLARIHEDSSITLYTDDGFEAERMWVAVGSERKAALAVLAPEQEGDPEPQDSETGDQPEPQPEPQPEEGQQDGETGDQPEPQPEEAQAPARPKSGNVDGLTDEQMEQVNKPVHLVRDEAGGSAVCEFNLGNIFYAIERVERVTCRFCQRIVEREAAAEVKARAEAEAAAQAEVESQASEEAEAEAEVNETGEAQANEASE